ncbi:MAG: glutamyl-tRNA reductase [Candidatus Zixiibacteriota bacterium]
MMLRFGVIGVSVRSGGNIPLLEALTVPEAEKRERLAALKESCGFREVVPLYTCNRSEFYYIADSGAGIAYRNRLLDFFLSGRERVAFEPAEISSLTAFRALRHLYRVTSSLDSMVVGEAQILGQVKEAVAFAEEAGLSGPELSAVFADAFRVARKIRRETPIGQYAVSMVNLLLDTISGRVSQRPHPRVVIVGVGPMSIKLGAHLRDAGATTMLFVNRTKARADELAARFGGASLSLEEFLAAPPAHDVLFTSTGSERPIFTRAFGERLIGLRGSVDPGVLIIDLAVPRDVDPVIGDLAGITYLDIPHFRSIADHNRRERFHAVDAAERMIDQAIGRAHKLNAQREFKPVLSSSLNESLAFAESGMRRLFASRLAHLPDTDRDAIAHWVRQLVQYSNQLPLAALAEQADIARSECALLAGYDCVEERADEDGDPDHSVAHRCAVREGGTCLGLIGDPLNNT